MARRRRSTLKHFFRQGAMPTTDQFGDLIDSTVNQVDDGFSKTDRNGLELSSRGADGKLVSFFREVQSDRPLWSMGYDQEQNKLLFEAQGTLPALALTPDGQVGIQCKDPEYALDVGGTIRAEGRIGVSPADRAIPADGEWHDITDTLSGCQALEVMAGFGVPGAGKYALVRAIAMNAHNPSGFLSNFLRRKNPIKCQQAFYGARGNKLQLRWAGEGRDYSLQIRSRCNCSSGKGEAKVYIRYYVTRLWFDPGMEACSRKASADAA